MPYTTPRPSSSLSAHSPHLGIPSIAADHEWQLFDPVPQAVIVTNIDGTVLYWNAAAESLYGWSEVEALGRSVLELTPTNASGAQARAIMERLRAGETFSGEFEVQRRDGTRFTAMVSDSPIYDAAGAVAGVVGMSWDLSPQKQREQELEAAKASAEEANCQKSEFLAMVSHELRTPLSAILGYNELLESGVGGELSGKHQLYAERIRMSAHHLRHVTDQILSLSRVMAGKDEVQLEAVPLHHFIVETTSLVSPDAAARGIELRVQVTDAGTVLQTDSGKLRQVLLNLLTNALKFTNAGYVELRAWTERERVTFEVRDTGIGFDPALTKQLFEPFFRAQPAEGSATGSGLGLAIVGRLVQLLGGEVEAQGAPGQGAVFRVRIPQCCPAGPPA